MASWLALRRLRVKLRRFLPELINKNQRIPDPDAILQEHIQRVPHFSASSAIPEAHEDGDGDFTLISEDDPKYFADFRDGCMPLPEASLHLSLHHQERIADSLR
ncbi:unnamed protein product [Mesocestoides corti]|uniref:Uncharacterized protein n=1 Tax=Mesocestoides corti TaxID=53468 RepID=A0A0R3UNH1_MESCO|nr:unnamed protein product [Mesocestoides corti]